MTRLVVHAPKRRLELAVPDQLPVVNLLPGLLRHAGEELADEGLAHGGWALRRTDGSVLDVGSSFAVQRVRDGETLHLVPRQLDWAEVAYDDVVDAIAASARGRGRRWTGEATRAAGLAAAGSAALVILIDLVLLDPLWTGSAATAGAVALLLLVIGTALARTAGDAGPGALVAATAMPFAFVGGLLWLADGPLGSLGAPHLLIGCAAMTACGVLGYLGTAAYAQLFIAGVTMSAWGTLGSAAAFTSLDGPEASALIVAAAVLAGPILPAVSVRLGRVPLPQLPRTPDDLAGSEPSPDPALVDTATARADQMLTGLLIGFGLASGAGFAVLVESGNVAGLLLTAAVSLAYLLRSRFYVGIRHRVPLLLTGASGLILLGIMPGAGGSADVRLAIVMPLAFGAAAAGLMAFSVYSRRAVSPRLGRLADVLDVILTLAVLPLACGVLGLFAYMRGFGG